MKWQIDFYSDKILQDTYDLPDKILSKLLHIFDLISAYGPNLGKPYTKYLGEGLFEIRAKGEEGIGRSLFCYAVGKRIVILSSFVKKSQKIPKHELDVAKERKKEIDNAK